MTWLWFAILYLLIGQIFSLVYLLSLKDDDRRRAWVGLLGLCWPAYLLFDLVLTVSEGMGAGTKVIMSRFEKRK